MPNSRIVAILTAIVAPSLFQLPVQSQEVLRDRWDVAVVGSDQIGYFHSLTRKIEVSGKPVLHTRQTSQLAIQRFGQQMKMEAVADYYELPDGRLYGTDTVTRISNEASHARGRLLKDGKFQVTIDAKGTKLNQTLDWPKGLLGPYAQDQSLRKQPLKPGETRSFVTFLPEMNVVANRKLTATDLQETPMRDGELAELLHVIETSDKVAIESSLWLDQQGNILKSVLPVADLKLTVFRATKEAALGPSKPSSLDLGVQTLVKPDKPAKGAHDAKSVTYRLEFGDATAADAIPQATYQTILAREQDNLRVQIRQAVPPQSAVGDTQPPGPEYLESNVYIQPDNPKIAAIARQTTDGAESDWEKVTRLEKWVDQNMSNQDFSVGFAPSSEVIETRQGDCTEHAVLLAALCRAVGIPARVAMGLVWLEHSGSFGYHMWTEVFVNGNWYPADGTLAMGRLGGGHIKIADGSLQGVDANSAFLPIFKVIGKLKIHVEEIERS